MKTHTLYVTIKVRVESELEIESVIDELSQDSYYDFGSTENVSVVETEWIDTNTSI